MRLPHVVFCSGALLLAVGCKDNPAKKTIEAVASAQAVASAAKAASQATVTGNIHSVGGALGTWDVALNDCRSGELNGFFGADFLVAGTTQLRLRYVHDEAKGEIVKVMIPSEKDSALQFDSDASCSVLEGSVEKMNGQTWTPKGYIRHVSGHVKFDCKHSKGAGRVSGQVTFEHCH